MQWTKCCKLFPKTPSTCTVCLFLVLVDSQIAPAELTSFIINQFKPNKHQIEKELIKSK